MIMSNKQVLDFLETDMQELQRRPEPVKPFTCVQTAGDVLIIPESWGHGVLNIQESVAVASELRNSLWRLKPNTIMIRKMPIDNRRG